VSGLPIRVRLTAAFALAMVVVLAAACLFVYVQLRSDTDQAIAGSLETRLAAAAALAGRGEAFGSADSGLLSEHDESFAQILRADGRVVASIGAVRGPALAGAELRRATRNRVATERRLAGFDDTARVLARPTPGGGGSTVVAVGQSLGDRNEALSALVRSFAVAGVLAVIVASLVGYALATAGLAPVEAMRRRASEISLSGDGERLPLASAHDEIRRLGETLNAMLDRLRRSFERERRFVADASHELRSPVAVVKTELEGALRTGDYGPGVRQALVAAVEECDRLAQLAEDLLVLARAGDGRLPARPEPLSAARLLEDARDRFVDRAAQRGRMIRIDMTGDVVVLADALRLRQALGNLVDNAVRHGAGEITLAARQAAAAVEIDVSDHGPGFAGALAEHAFERFTRADEARSGEGAGLGLAIVQAIADAHGGTAEIVRDAAVTTVRIVLPRGGDADTHPAAPAAAPSRAPERGASQARLM
jgi:signal transduction histidine kinase